MSEVSSHHVQTIIDIGRKSDLVMLRTHAPPHGVTIGRSFSYAVEWIS